MNLSSETPRENALVNRQDQYKDCIKLTFKQRSWRWGLTYRSYEHKNKILLVWQFWNIQPEKNCIVDWAIVLFISLFSSSKSSESTCSVCLELNFFFSTIFPFRSTQQRAPFISVWHHPFSRASFSIRAASKSQSLKGIKMQKWS